MAKIVSVSGVAPFSIAGADGWTLTDWFENVYLRTAGPVLYDRLTRHEIPWTDPSVEVALTVLAQVFGRTEWLPGGTDMALQTDFPTSVIQTVRTPPKAAMVDEGDFVAGVITGETRARLGTDVDFFNFPSIHGAPSSVVGGGDVAVLLRESEGGKALLRFLTSPEAGRNWARLGGFTSTNRGVSLSAYPDEVSRRSAVAKMAHRRAVSGMPRARQWRAKLSSWRRFVRASTRRAPRHDLGSRPDATLLQTRGRVKGLERSVDDDPRDRCFVTFSDRSEPYPSNA